MRIAWIGSACIPKYVGPIYHSFAYSKDQLPYLQLLLEVTGL